jgi:hypothetical protein
MAIGVFGLQVAYKLKRTELLSTDDTHGWFHFSGSIFRMDFSNDSGRLTPRGPLSLQRSVPSATGNSNYGWFGGGYTGFGGGATPTSAVDRIDFSNDSATALSRGVIRARRNLAATGNSNYGWFGGGFSTVAPFSGNISVVDRIDFSNDSATASPRGNLSLARRNLGATGNSNYGWFGGGYIQSPFAPYSTVDRIDFSNDSATASVRGTLSAARYGLAATGNSNYGWFGGAGLTGGSLVDRIDFSSDSVAASSRGLLTATRYSLAATGNSNYGWFGGNSPSTIDRINFFNDLSSASPRGSLGTFTDVATSGQAKGTSIRLQRAGNFGWFKGWATSTVDRINFSNDSATASSRSILSSARYYAVATGNSNYGWFGGGTNPSPFVILSEVVRMDFSNDSAIASTRGPLSSPKYFLAATGNSNYGWFGGGLTTGPAPVSTVDRINFSNDSTTASVRGSLSLSRSRLAATGNSNYGWFGGGYVPGPDSRVQRIDFSNDSAIASPRGPLSSPKNFLAATGNSNYGWFGGGYAQVFPSPSPAAGTRSTVDRIDFSNDSTTASPRGPLSLARYSLAATGNSNYGWFGGGQLGFSVFSQIQRIDFSNDSVTAPERGILITTTRTESAISNTPIG